MNPVAAKESVSKGPVAFGGVSRGAEPLWRGPGQRPAGLAAPGRCGTLAS
jgi:hypothetical protein